MTKIVLMVKSGMVDVVECPEDVKIFLRDYDAGEYANDTHDIHYDDEGEPYIELQLN